MFVLRRPGTKSFTIARSARRRASTGAVVSPNTTDSLGARKANVPHQVNHVVAQSKIRRRPLQGDHMVDPLASDRSDQSFGKAVLPRRAAKYAVAGCQV